MHRKDHRGRPAVEFSSVVDALRCATEVQNGMAKRNAEVPPDRRIEFRVGIHMGEIVVKTTTSSGML